MRSSQNDYDTDNKTQEDEDGYSDSVVNKKVIGVTKRVMIQMMVRKIET